MNHPVQSFAHTFVDLDTAPFSTLDYSRLKFGSDEVAYRYGCAMADTFYRDHRDFLREERCVVIPSAYNVVEIAATVLGRHFMNRLNDLLVRDGGDIVEWTTMHRTMRYLNDYADVTAEERKALLDQDDLYIKKEFVAGKSLIFVDDIYITGTHERKLVSFLDQIDFQRPAYFCYFAKYLGDRAKIEGDLNRSGIGDLPALVDMILTEKTHIMVRTLRMWLQAPERTLRLSLERVPPAYVDDLYHAILARGYYSVPELRAGFEFIRAYRDTGRFVAAA